MSVRAYISNLAPGWPVERQEALLAAHVPDWPNVTVYRDILDARTRRANDPADLVNRAAMLRPTGKLRDAETIYVASYAVLAVRKADFEGVQAAVKARGATIRAFDGAQAPSLPAFVAARVEGSRKQARENGIKVSAERRRARADEGCERIKPLWGTPNTENSTTALLALAGEPGEPLSYNTVVARLGGREAAQRRYQAALKRKACRERPEAD